MKVSQILARKGSMDVASIADSASVDEAVKDLARRKIGALVVLGTDGAMAGILSERDVVRAIGEDGIGALQGRVGDLMTRDVETCSPDEKTDSVLDRMTRGRFRHMPVMDAGAMQGLVSIGDVVKARIDEIEQENRAMFEMMSQ